jgi:hypothetical protein
MATTVSLRLNVRAMSTSTATSIRMSMNPIKSSTIRSPTSLAVRSIASFRTRSHHLSPHFSLIQILSIKSRSMITTQPLFRAIREQTLILPALLQVCSLGPPLISPTTIVPVDKSPVMLVLLTWLLHLTPVSLLKPRLLGRKSLFDPRK